MDRISMLQCQACASYNEPDVAFCGQCGAPLYGRKKHRRGDGRRRLGILALVFLLCLLGVVLVIVSDRPEKGRAKDGGADAARVVVVDGGAADSSVTAVDAVSVRNGDEDGSEAAGGEEDRAVAPESVLRAVVVLELSDRADQPLREVRGLLVSPDGLVACRFTPLLGAYKARARLLGVRGPRRRVKGLISRNEAVDLALVQLEPRGQEAGGAGQSPVGRDDPFVGLIDVHPVELVEEQLYVFSHARAKEGVLVDSRFITPSGVTGLLVEAEPLADPFVLTDAAGLLVGFFRETVGAGATRFEPRSRLLFDSAAWLRGSLQLPVGMTLEAMTVRLWEGTFGDWFRRGIQAVQAKRWADGVESFVNALERRSLDQPSEERLRQAEDHLRNCYSRQIEKLVRGSRWANAVGVLEAALANFPENGEFWITLGEARLELSEPAEAIVALLEARKFSARARSSALLEEAYLRVAAGHLAGDNSRAAELTLLEGIEKLPGAATLQMKLGSLYLDMGAYLDATRALERARSLDPRLEEVVEGRLETIRRILSRRDALVIPIRPGSNSIRSNVVVDGAREHPFIIDTGATFTAIPTNLAESLGYNLKRADKVSVRTAGGVVMAPVIHARSIDLGGYTVRNLRVIVLPSEVGPRYGLLGMNFLKHFRYTVENNEFRLERQ